MNAPLLDTDLVFSDLLDAKRALDDAKGSPREVRRAFSRFVDLTQRLTSTMRTDYSRLRSAKWEAKDFKGWTVDTDFLKWLRNEDQHASQIYVSVHQRNFYRIEAAGDKLIAVEGTWVLIDQMTTDVPSGMSFHLPNSDGGISDEVVQPVHVEYQYLFQPRTAEAQEWFRKVGNSDIHLLAERALLVLSSYHDYFQAKIDT
jgi:hypothetical protein